MTDLGTEFGVEVSKKASPKPMFSSVKCESPPAAAETRREQTRGHPGRPVRTCRDATKRLSMGEHPLGRRAKRFTRVMPGRRRPADAYAELVLSMKPAVYYRMEEWPKGKDEDSYVLVDSGPGGHHGVLHQDRSFGPRRRGKFGTRLIFTGRESATMPSCRTIPRPITINFPSRLGCGRYAT